jgi:tetratricopeptide (TPR) repeat protein
MKPAAVALFVAAAVSCAPMGDARALTREATQAYADGHVGRAMDLIEQALRSDPGSVEALLFRAGASALAGQLAEAVQDYDAILRSDPAHHEALVGRALATSALQRHDDALTSADALVHAQPKSVDAIALRAYVQARAGRHVPSYADYTSAREIDPDRWKWYYNAGVRELNGRRLEGAVRHLEIAAGLAGDRPEPLVALGRALAEQRRYDQADAAYTRALDFRPDHAETLYMRAAVRLARLRTREAIDDLDKAIKAEPSIFAFYIARGLARRVIGAIDGAEEDFTQAIKLNSQARDAYRYRAQLRYDLGILGDAEKDYIAALGIEAAPEDVRALARLYVDREEVDRALQLYENALKMPLEPGVREQMELELAALRKMRDP